MIDVEAVKISLPLKKKFAVSKGSATVKTNLLTILNNRYHGEAAGSVYAGPQVEEIEKGIRKGMEYLRKVEKIDVDTLYEANNWDIPPAARSAIIAMIVNYLSGESKRYPWEILSLGTPVGIRSSITISVDDPAKMIDAIKESDYPIIKVKMGTEGDIELLKLFDQVTDKEIRVDANGAWSCEKAEEMMAEKIVPNFVHPLTETIAQKRLS